MDKDQIKQNLKDMAALSQSPTPKAALDLINELEGALHKIAPTVTITLDQLKSLNACEEQLKLFEEVFGDTVSFKTEAQATKVAVKMAHKFDFGWASDNLLKGGYRKAHEEAEASLYKAYEEAREPLLKAYEEAVATLWKAYKEAEAPLYKAYKEAEAPLYEAYEEAVAPLLKAYEEAIAPLSKAYEEAIAPLWKTYKEAIAKEFAKYYFDQEKNHS